MKNRLSLLILLSLCSLVFAERTYQFSVTVGKDPAKYDFTTINDAIENLAAYELASDKLACIKVYKGIYKEQLNSFYPGGNNLLANCDLIGMGGSPSDVVIEHQRRSGSDPNFTDLVSEIYAAGIYAKGNNKIHNLKVFNNGSNQNTIKSQGHLILSNCIVISYHDAVTAYSTLEIDGCSIEGWYRPCIHTFSTFEIRNSTLYPKTRSWGGQHPAGIKAYKSGVVENVNIQANIESSDYEPHYDAPWLAGVIANLRNPEDVITIKNTSMDLTLTTLYHDNKSNETATWQLFGVVSGGRNPSPTTDYPGAVIVEDCNIVLNGIEGSTDPNGDGRAIMVAGVCARGSGLAQVIGNTNISTSRTTASYVENGYEYSLNNQNGTLEVQYATVVYDKDKTNGTITEYIPFREQRQEYLINCPYGENEWQITDFSLPLTTSPTLSSKSAANASVPAKLIKNALSSTVTVVDKDIITDTTWKSGSVYLVSKDVNVQAVLTIEPGAIVKYQQNASLLVNDGGKIIAKGAEGSPIYLVPDSNNIEYGYYDCAIGIQSTASKECEISNCVIQGSVIGIKTENISLDSAITDNYLLHNVYGIVETGPGLTDLKENYIFASHKNAIEIFMTDVSGNALNSSKILLEKNACDHYQDVGILVHGVAKSEDAGLVELKNNLISQSGQYGLSLADGYMIGIVSNTGYYSNAKDKNWSFGESSAVSAITYTQDELTDDSKESN